MFGRKRRQERNDWEDFMAQSKGQDFALFKHLGGLAGVEQVLAGLPALTATIPDREVAETWMTATVKTGYSVISSFYTAYLADSEKKRDEPSLLASWRNDISSNSDLDEMKIDLSRVEALRLTGFDKSLPRSVFFQLVRHPYRILPAEILAQLPTAFNKLSRQEWDTFLCMYAQPTVHDAAGGFNKVMELNGAPESVSMSGDWRMDLAQWRTNIPQGVPIGVGADVGTIVDDPKISAHDRILVMKVPHKMLID